MNPFEGHSVLKAWIREFSAVECRLQVSHVCALLPMRPAHLRTEAAMVCMPYMQNRAEHLEHACYTTASHEELKIFEIKTGFLGAL